MNPHAHNHTCAECLAPYRVMDFIWASDDRPDVCHGCKLDQLEKEQEQDEQMT